MSDRKLHTTNVIENRAFGRRSIVRHAWITSGQRSRLSCCIRNLSVGGALLELDVPAWLPYNFELVIDDPKMVIACEVKHRGLHGVGVSFLSNLDGLTLLESCNNQTAYAPQPTPKPGRLETSWPTGHGPAIPAELWARGLRAHA